MILDLIFGVLLALLTALFAVLPGFTGPFCLHSGCGGAVDGLVGMGSYLRLVSRWIDVRLFISVIGLIGTAFAVWGAVWIALWVYRNLPGKAA